MYKYLNILQSLNEIRSYMNIFIYKYTDHQFCLHSEILICVKVAVNVPTDRRVGEESLEQPWLRGMRLRLRPSVLDPANTLWGPELMVLSAVLVNTRPGEPLRLPALKIKQK